MEKIVRAFIKHSLSAEDIMNICNGETNLRTISELRNVRDIDQILHPYGSCLILYDRKNGSPGHWSCVIKHGNVLEFFCPYGFKPDRALKYINNKPYLSNLLLKSGYDIVYNDVELQEYKNNVNVCGRYCGLRLLLKDMNLKDFANLFLKNKCYNSDFWVTVLTLFCEN